MLFDWVAGAALLEMANRFWPLSCLIKSLVPKAMKDAESSHRILTRKILDKRLANPVPCVDL